MSAFDFRPTLMYRAYAEDGGLLYVGVTGDIEERLRGHAQSSDWFPLAKRIETEAYETRRLALDAEYRAIVDEGPLHNRPPKRRLVLPPVFEREAAS